MGTVFRLKRSGELNKRSSTARVPLTCLVALYCAAVAVFLASPVSAQDYTQQIGSPTFSSMEPVELGFVNAGNGNLHMEISLASFPQRARRPLSYSLVYDSRLWLYSASYWVLTSNAASLGGWRFVSSADAGRVGNSSWMTTCNGGQSNSV